MTADRSGRSLDLITLEGVGVRFGEVQALQPMDLSLRRGERLALVGANGSGKTTLLRVLHGLVPHHGRRTMHDIDGRPPVVAMLFQRPFLLDLSVRFNLQIGLVLQRVTRHERARICDEVLRRAGLSEQASRRARDLSGGQQQRLALPRACALRPDLLLLDEPTASLDPTSRRQVEAQISSIADEGVTIVMSTHNLGQARRLATRVAYLEAGRMVTSLPTSQFFSVDTLPPEAARFLKDEAL